MVQAVAFQSVSRSPSKNFNSTFTPATAPGFLYPLSGWPAVYQDGLPFCVGA